MPGSSYTRIHPVIRVILGWYTTYTDLIHDSDACVLGLLFELEHGRRHVACSDNILLFPDRGLNDSSVKGVGDQAYNKVMLRYRSVESLVIIDIQRDWLCELYTFGKLFCVCKSSTG